MIQRACGRPPPSPAPAGQSSPGLAPHRRGAVIRLEPGRDQRKGPSLAGKGASLRPSGSHRLRGSPSPGRSPRHSLGAQAPNFPGRDARDTGTRTQPRICSRSRTGGSRFAVENQRVSGTAPLAPTRQSRPARRQLRLTIHPLQVPQRTSEANCGAARRCTVAPSPDWCQAKRVRLPCRGPRRAKLGGALQ